MRRVILILILFFSERTVWGWGGGLCCETFSFVLFSLFRRPRAGLATMQSSFLRVGNQHAECEKQQQQVMGGFEAAARWDYRTCLARPNFKVCSTQQKTKTPVNYFLVPLLLVVSVTNSKLFFGPFTTNLGDKQRKKKSLVMGQKYTTTTCYCIACNTYIPELRSGLIHAQLDNTTPNS